MKWQVRSVTARSSKISPKRQRNEEWYCRFRVSTTLVYSVNYSEYVFQINAQKICVLNACFIETASSLGLTRQPLGSVMGLLLTVNKAQKSYLNGVRTGWIKAMILLCSLPRGHAGANLLITTKKKSHQLMRWHMHSELHSIPRWAVSPRGTNNILREHSHAL